MGLVGLVLFVVLAASVISSYQTEAQRLELAVNQAFSSGPDSEQLPWVGGQDAEQFLLELLSSLQGYNPLFTDGQNDGTQSRRQGQNSVPPVRGSFTPVYIAIVDRSTLTVFADNSAFVVIDDSLAGEAFAHITKRLPQQEATGAGGTSGSGSGTGTSGASSESGAGSASTDSTGNTSSTGLIPDLKLFYRAEDIGGGSMAIALADASSLIDNTLQMAGSSALIWLGAMVVFFVISLLLSHIALRPAAEAWKRQRRFVADASHELKTPLTVILANNSLLLAHPNRTITEQRQWIDSTQAEAQRMDSLVRDLLLLAQTDEEERLANTGAALRQPVDLSALVRRVLLQFEAVLFERNVSLTTEIADGITVTGNEEQLARLVQILLDNASKYAEQSATGGEGPVQSEAITAQDVAVVTRGETTTGSGKTAAAQGVGAAAQGETAIRSSVTIPTQGEEAAEGEKATIAQGAVVTAQGIAAIDITLRAGTGIRQHAVLRVTNSGNVIDPEVLPHLFERFYRADHARGTTEGSGLGLSLAQAIVKTHHGSIGVTSTPTTGTTFTITL
jgi:signal transduction histidine kinase